MRGSSAGTDFFELGSSGTNDNGQLQFTIGDDGNEPIIFRKYNYSPVAFVEMMRMQGTGLNSNVRTGINTSGAVANSTFQVVGSVSQSISTTSTSLTLDESHSTIIANNTAATTITLPAASSCRGRIYIVKKTGSGTINISSFLNNTGNATNSIGALGVFQIQSDGTNWQQIN